MTSRRYGTTSRRAPSKLRYCGGQLGTILKARRPLDGQIEPRASCQELPTHRGNSHTRWEILRDCSTAFLNRSRTTRDRIGIGFAPAVWTGECPRANPESRYKRLGRPSVRIFHDTGRASGCSGPPSGTCQAVPGRTGHDRNAGYCDERPVLVSPSSRRSRAGTNSRQRAETQQLRVRRQVAVAHRFVREQPRAQVLLVRVREHRHDDGVPGHVILDRERGHEIRAGRDTDAEAQVAGQHLRHHDRIAVVNGHDRIQLAEPDHRRNELVRDALDPVATVLAARG